MSGGDGMEIGRFRKSSHSQSLNDCVEVAPVRCGGTAVRDSKLGGASPVLKVGPAGWRALLDLVKASEL
jgi:hypothetical protein